MQRRSQQSGHVWFKSSTDGILRGWGEHPTMSSPWQRTTPVRPGTQQDGDALGLWRGVLDRCPGSQTAFQRATGGSRDGSQNRDGTSTQTHKSKNKNKNKKKGHWQPIKKQEDKRVIGWTICTGRGFSNRRKEWQAYVDVGNNSHGPDRLFHGQSSCPFSPR